MTINILISFLAAYQFSSNSEPGIWEQITSLESFIKTSVGQNETDFVISQNDPVRGYYIEGRGVFLLIPVRYRAKAEPPQPSKKETQLLKDQPPAKLDKFDIQKRLSDWKEMLRKKELIKEANFERVVTNMKQAIPEILKILEQLPDNEALTVIVEERIPAWYYPGFSLNKNPTTKVVTLSVDKGEVSLIKANRTVLKTNWQRHVVRKNANRKLASYVP